MHSSERTKTGAGPRIGFLFNHDQIHQIAHSLPVALALAKLLPQTQISIATTNARIKAEVDRLLGADAPTNICCVSLRIHTVLARAADCILGKIVPVAKLLILPENLDYFRTLDIIVVTERTSLALKQRHGMSHLKMVLIDHGAGDRAIGFGPSTAAFDYILAAGPKIRDRLIAEAHVQPNAIKITGYPKFDAVRPEFLSIPAIRPRLPFASNGNPTVLYNPHPSPYLSSWFRHGRAVLDWFVAHPEYNLIFAPHIMLFQRPVVFTIDKLRVAMPGKIADTYRQAPNIHIDLGSVASTDMTYTQAADIYLGDASSQIYEFLLRPRPAIFINSHNILHTHDPNFAHWQTGDVISEPDELADALASAEARHSSIYKPVQIHAFNHSFDLTDEPSSQRAARAIAEIFNHG